MANPPETMISEPRRFAIRLPRPLWFGVATFVLVVVAVGLPLAVPIIRQQVSIREIREHGGEVKSFDAVPSWIPLTHSTLYCVERERIVFRRVHDVDMQGGRADDAALATIAALPHLRRLDLTLTHVTDAGMPHLSKLGALEILILSGTQVTDEGLVHLKEMKNLRSLHVIGTQISSEGIYDLKERLPELRVEGLGTVSGRRSRKGDGSARRQQVPL